MSPLRRNNAFVDGGGESTTTTTTHAFPYLGAKADAEGTTNTKARTTLFWNCIFKTALSVCVFLSTTELDTFALSRLVLLLSILEEENRPVMNVAQ